MATDLPHHAHDSADGRDVEPPLSARGREAELSTPWWMRTELWLALAVVGLIVPGVLFARRPAADPLPPHLGQLAPFTLVRESGAPFRSADLAGKIWVADFVFLG